MSRPRRSQSRKLNYSPTRRTDSRTVLKPTSIKPLPAPKPRRTKPKERSRARLEVGSIGVQRREMMSRRTPRMPFSLLRNRLNGEHRRRKSRPRSCRSLDSSRSVFSQILISFPHTTNYYDAFTAREQQRGDILDNRTFQ